MNYRTLEEVEAALAKLSEATGQPARLTGLKDGRYVEYTGQEFLFDTSVLNGGADQVFEPLWWIAHEWAHWETSPHRRGQRNWGWPDRPSYMAPPRTPEDYKLHDEEILAGRETSRRLWLLVAA